MKKICSEALSSFTTFNKFLEYMNEFEYDPSQSKNTSLLSSSNLSQKEIDSYIANLKNQKEKYLIIITSKYLLIFFSLLSANLLRTWPFKN